MGWIPSFWSQQPAQPPAANAQQQGADACPVDHKTRQAWLDQARSQSSSNPAPNPHATQAPSPQPTPSPKIPVGESCDSSQIDASNTATPAVSRALSKFSLDQSREISTIPRAALSSSSPGNTAPANNENESGSSTSGNWIYPSEQMFFEAMRRKSYSPEAADMKTIVPIHNAVNEQAWKEIKAWEAGRGSEKCGGPKLVSFSGQATAMTPRARINTMLGYAAPFDRHDWIVDRCGEHVEYVIDFYAGKDEGKVGKSLNFYLDVRPKLNSFEGWRMRAMRTVGL